MALDQVTVPVDALGELYRSDRRDPHAGRPWMVLNMIASIDGGVSIDGRSGGLGGPADRAVFSALRGLADTILVAAGTVRAEGYGPPRPAEPTRARRRERGQAPAPRLAIVTASLDLDPTASLFTEAEEPPVVVTTEDAPGERAGRLEPVAELVRAGHGRVDLPAAVAELGGRGMRVVLVEGGPSLNGQLVADDLIDEVCVTTSPLLVGGEAPRLAHGPVPDAPRRYRLDRVVHSDGLLLSRYLRAASADDEPLPDG